MLKMASSVITLKVKIVDSGSVRTMQFDGSLIVYDVCKEIQEKLGEGPGGADHGLFVPNEDYSRGKWLHPGRTLDYYDLKSGDLVEYKKKHRPLRVILMDESQRTVLIDDSHTVGQIIKVICARINLSNADEFSLTVDELDRSEQSAGGIYEESKKEKEKKAKDEKKMLKLQEKLHTDDELNWLNHDKSLREQGVGENDTVRLRKKFFFSDQNVDRNDPVQLNLMYVQARDDILKATHPCSLDEAVQFAAMQCQVQLGDHNPQTHGSLDLGKYLPAEHAKAKGIEKRILQEHRKLKGLTELNAKYRYIQLCRSLKTYGMTFFLVKEKVKGKNKIVPRLLGVSRSSIMRVDEKTKEVLKEWPLSTVRRWAASPNSFTLDFGDYADEYYSVSTTEGETISRLIAGYIDFILKKKKESEFRAPEDNGAAATVTEHVGGAQGNALHMVQPQYGRATETSVGRVGTVQGTRSGIAVAGRMNLKQGSVALPQQMQRTQLALMAAGASPAEVNNQLMAIQQNAQIFTAGSALVGNLQSANAVVNSCNSDLNAPTSLPPIGLDPASLAWKKNTLDINAQNVATQLAAMSATTANVLQLNTEERSEQTLMAAGSSVVSIASNLAELTKGAKILAALRDNEDDQDAILMAGRNLADAVSKLFQAVHPENEVETKDFIAASSAVGRGIADMLKLVPQDVQVNDQAQSDLMDLAKNIQNAIGGLVNASKVVANKADDPVSQSKVIDGARAAAVATATMISCTKVLAPTINNMQCQESPVDEFFAIQESLIAAAKALLARVNELVDTSKAACTDKKPVEDVEAEALKVKSAIAGLVSRAKNAGESMEDILTYDSLASDVAARAMRLDTNDRAEVTAIAKDVDSLVTCIEADAAKEGPDGRDALLAMAKNLAEACAALQASALPKFQQAAIATADDARQRKVMRTLEVAVKNATQVCTQLIAASTNAAATNRNAASQKQLMEQAKLMGDSLAHLVGTAKEFASNRSHAQKQLDLINEAKAIVSPGSKLVATAKVATATVGDKAAAKQLTNFGRAAAVALTELKLAQNAAAEACGKLEIIAAMAAVGEQISYLKGVQEQADTGALLPMAGDTRESSTLEVHAITKTIGSSMAQLLSAASQGNESQTGTAARDTAAALAIFANAARAVAALNTNPVIRTDVLKAAMAVVVSSKALIASAKWALEHGSAEERMPRLHEAAKDVQAALQDVLRSLPGQRDIDLALNTVKQAQAHIESPMFASGATDGDALDARMKLNEALLALDAAAAQLAAAAKISPEQLATATVKYDRAFRDTMAMGETLCRVEPAATDDIKAQLKSVTVCSTSLLSTARNASRNPSVPQTRADLSAATNVLKEALDLLSAKVSLAGPGGRECAAAQRHLSTLAVDLEGPVVWPAEDMSYTACLQVLNKAAPALSQAVKTMGSAGHSGELQNMGNAAEEANQHITDIAMAATQAAYLIGASDPTSTPAVQGCFDAGLVLGPQAVIVEACDLMLSPSAMQSEILDALTEVAKNTNALCAACKTAANTTGNAAARQNFIAAARHIAASTQAVVPDVKALAANPTDTHRQKVAESTQQLLDMVTQLATLAQAPEFQSQPAQLPSSAIARQKPILSSTRALVMAASHVMDAGNAIALNFKDGNAWAVFDGQTRVLGDNLRQLLECVRDNVPGQAECQKAMVLLREAINDLDHAELGASGGSLNLRSDNDLQGFMEAMLTTCQEINNEMDNLVTFSKSDAQKLGSSAHEFSELHLPLVSSAVGAASKLADRRKQLTLLSTTKKMATSSLALVAAAKAAAGDGDNKAGHGKVDDAATQFQLDCAEIIRLLEAATGDAGALSGIAANVQRSMQTMAAGEDSHPDGTYLDRNTQMVATARKLALTVPEVLSVQTGELVSTLRHVANIYNVMVGDARTVNALSNNHDANTVLVTSVQELGASIVNLVQACKAVQANAEDFETRRGLSSGTQQVSSSIAKVLAALQLGVKGIRACEAAIQSVEGVIADLATTGMFASAGSLTSENPEDKFEAKEREAVNAQAAEVLSAARALGRASTITQEELAGAGHRAQSSVEALAKATRHGAMAVGSGDRGAQELLLNGTRDVAAGMKHLLECCLEGGSQGVDEAVKGVEDRVKDLGSIVSSVENEKLRGPRATESAAAAIKAEMADYVNPDEGLQKADATPDQLAQSTRALTAGSTKLASAAGLENHNEVMEAANQMRKAAIDIMRTGKGAMANSPNADEFEITAANKAIIATAEMSVRLLEAANKHLLAPSTATKEALPAQSMALAEAITEVCDAARALKGEAMEDPDDPHVIAEKELLAAAAQIELAAKMLAEIKPRVQDIDLNKDINFDAVIITAAQSITNATTALMQAAQAAQKELIQSGRLSTVKGTERYHDDITWSEGLVSAAKNVAASVSMLCEAANTMVQGQAGEERLVSAAMSVSAATQHLLIACRVKATKDSKAMARLDTAGAAVRKATQELVKSAKEASARLDETQEIELNQQKVGSIAQEIAMQELILKKEKELENARRQLVRMRQQKYSKSPTQ